LIAEKQDSQALYEFHGRPLFCDGNERGLTCSEYISFFRVKTFNYKGMDIKALEIADIAYDLTIDKFSNLFSETKLHILTGKKDDQQMKQTGSNCCFYFKAYLDHVQTTFKEKPPKSELESECRAVALMHGLVKMQFFRSRLEAERKVSRSWSRYCWEQKQKKINIWLPISLKGNERKKWLEKNIINPDPLRPNERKRIQTIINKHFFRGYHFSFNDNIAPQTDHNDMGPGGFKNIKGLALAFVVAEEKALNLEKQRPGIKNLGSLKLKKIIVQIFNEIRDGCYRDSKIAKKYGLSKSTFSRFAGSHWRDSKSNSIPDLWMNTAQVLATHRAFKELARNSGVWEKVKATVNSTIAEASPNE